MTTLHPAESEVDAAPRSPLGILFGQQVDDLGPLTAYGELCQLRETRLWLGQSMTIESHLALAALAGRGVRVDTGLGVAVAPLTTPTHAWAQARSIGLLTGRSVSACWGIGSLAAAEALRGRAISAPAHWMREFVAGVAAQRDGDRTIHEAVDVEVGCGVLRPTMARHAAAVSDVVVTWLTPVDHIRRTLLPALREGATAAGRAVPRVVSILPCALRRADRHPVQLAATAVGQHIRLPHYADMLRQAGVDLIGDRAHDLRATLSSGVFAYGSSATIASRVRDHLRAGVDEVVLHTGSVGLVHGHQAALDDVIDVLDASDRRSSDRHRPSVRQIERPPREMG